MKVLVTGANGYIGKRLIPVLLNNGHEVVCSVRDKSRFHLDHIENNEIDVVEVDFLNPNTLRNIPKDIDAAYYLIHSMTYTTGDFGCLETDCAENFKLAVSKTNIKQVIYLSGITNHSELSKHLESRKHVEELLVSDNYSLTIFKAGIIVGSGSSSFEIIRDLVEKLPVMVAPKWLNTKTQPIGVRDVLSFLSNAVGNENLHNKTYDIFGPEVLTYKQMLMQFASVRGLSRYILTIPVMTPKLSSYWLYFVTSTSYKLARNLVDSMGVEIIGKSSNINKMLNVNPMTYKEAVEKAFIKIKQNSIISSWKDSFISGRLRNKAYQYVDVPEYGCFVDRQKHKIISHKKTIKNIWKIGGNNGWYYGTILWRIRGLLDVAVGGIGLRRGRKSDTDLNVGDALDFWRVIFANKDDKKLLLYAEMKLPGEAWLEFKIENDTLYQTATFRPRGLAGRMYWYVLEPFHWFIFRGMINRIAI